MNCGFFLIFTRDRLETTGGCIVLIFYQGLFSAHAQIFQGRQAMAAGQNKSTSQASLPPSSSSMHPTRSTSTGCAEVFTCTAAPANAAAHGQSAEKPCRHSYATVNSTFFNPFIFTLGTSVEPDVKFTFYNNHIFLTIYKLFQKVPPPIFPLDLASFSGRCTRILGMSEATGFLSSKANLTCA
jgi:hypothetical protein